MPAKHAARARLFLPFDSLKGFREYLAEKEQPQESKKMLSEDDCERIDHLLRQLAPGGRGDPASCGRATWQRSFGMQADIMSRKRA